MPECLVQQIEDVLVRRCRQIGLKVLFEIHLTVKSHPDHFELSPLAKVAHTELYLEQSSYLGKVTQIYADALTQLDELSLGQCLTAL